MGAAARKLLDPTPRFKALLLSLEAFGDVQGLLEVF
jgi:hypothetical protein